MPLLSTSTVLLSCAGFVGLILLVFGLRGRRVGHEPHCRKCSYNLTGIDSLRCPECGSAVNDGNIVRGTRQRRRRLLLASLPLLLFCTAGLTPRIYGNMSGLNWYTYYPDFLIVRYARQNDMLAVRELSRRFTIGDVAPSAVIDLIPQALNRQGADPYVPTEWPWTLLLVNLDGVGLLRGSDRERFFDQLVDVHFEFQSPVRQGEELMVSIGWSSRGAPGMVGSARFRVDQQQVGSWIGRTGTIQEIPLFAVTASGSSGRGFGTKEFAPGLYAAECIITKSFLLNGDSDWNSPTFEQEVWLGGGLEVLATTPETIKVVNDPSITQQFKDAITISLPDKSRAGPADPGLTTLQIQLTGAIPMDAAFEVIGVVNGIEVNCGTLVVEKSSAGRTHRRQVHLALGEGDTAVFILRSSREVAKTTTNLFEIWGGELRFDPIGVTPAE